MTDIKKYNSIIPIYSVAFNSLLLTLNAFEQSRTTQPRVITAESHDPRMIPICTYSAMNIHILTSLP